MEYEIGDDPQGLPDRSEAHRDGGLRDDGVFFSKDEPAKTGTRYEESPVKQLGEAV